MFSEMTVGEIFRVKYLVCIKCRRASAHRLKGFFINWFGYKMEEVFPKVKCPHCEEASDCLI